MIEYDASIGVLHTQAELFSPADTLKIDRDPGQGTFIVLAQAAAYGLRGAAVSSLTGSIVSTGLREGAPHSVWLKALQAAVPGNDALASPVCFTALAIRPFGAAEVTVCGMTPPLLLRHGCVRPYALCTETVAGREVHHADLRLAETEALLLCTDAEAANREARKIRLRRERLLAALDPLISAEADSPALAKAAERELRRLCADRPPGEFVFCAVRIQKKDPDRR